MPLFPMNAQALGSNVRVRNIEDAFSIYRTLDPAITLLDRSVYPEHEFDTFQFVLERTSDGKIVPLSDYADDTARVAATTTLGLLNRTLQSYQNPHQGDQATIHTKASAVSFPLLTPATLAAADVWVHPAVDSDTSKLHPFKVVVNSTSTNAIAKITNQNTTEIYGATVRTHVWAGMISDEYRSVAGI